MPQDEPTYSSIAPGGVFDFGDQIPASTPSTGTSTTDIHVEDVVYDQAAETLTIRLNNGDEFVRFLPADRGEKGDQGDPGPQGVPGPQGNPGQDGVDGQDGSDGQDGLPGMDGAPGAQGPQGDTGPQGGTGAPGGLGPQGPAGPAGQDGQQGADGADGTDGADGADGISITNVNVSDDGDVLTPIPGRQYNVFITFSDGTTDTETFVAPVGPTGAQGPGGGGSTAIDTALSLFSGNPVENRAVTAGINAKQDTLTDYTPDDWNAKQDPLTFTDDISDPSQYGDHDYVQAIGIVTAIDLKQDKAVTIRTDTFDLAAQQEQASLHTAGTFIFHAPPGVITADDVTAYVVTEVTGGGDHRLKRVGTDQSVLDMIAANTLNLASLTSEVGDVHDQLNFAETDIANNQDAIGVNATNITANTASIDEIERAYIKSIEGPVAVADEGQEYTATLQDNTTIAWTTTPAGSDTTLVDNTAGLIAFSEASATPGEYVWVRDSNRLFIVEDNGGVNSLVLVNPVPGATFMAVANPAAIAFSLYDTDLENDLVIDTANALGLVDFSTPVMTSPDVTVTGANGVYQVFIADTQTAGNFGTIAITATDSISMDFVNLLISVTVADSTLRPSMAVTNSSLNRAQSGTQTGTLSFREYPPTAAQISSGISYLLNHPDGSTSAGFDGTPGTTASTAGYGINAINFPTSGTYNISSTYSGQHAGALASESLSASRSFNAYAATYYGFSTENDMTIPGDLERLAHTNSETSTGTFTIPSLTSTSAASRMVLAFPAPRTVSEIVSMGIRFNMQSLGTGTLNGVTYNVFVTQTATFPPDTYTGFTTEVS